MYGNGSDGELNLLSGRTLLQLNRRYQYTSVFIGSGATLGVQGKGSTLYIEASEEIVLDGRILIEASNPPHDAPDFVVGAETFKAPPSSPGGSGGAGLRTNGGYGSSAGYGGGGAGGHWTGSWSGNAGAGGGNGGTPPAPGATAYHIGGNLYVSHTPGNSAGASGIRANNAYGGQGGSAYGGRGANGAGAGGADVAGGGGGGGGVAGAPGVTVVLRAPKIRINGYITTVAGDGGLGGDGGSSTQAATAGSGGGGGGAGNAARIILDSPDLIDNGRHTVDPGKKGKGGSGYRRGEDGGTAAFHGSVEYRGRDELYKNGYRYRKKILINPSKVVLFSGQYRMLIKHTDPDLRSVSNGGYVEFDKVLDIRFEEWGTPGEGRKLAYELVDYDINTGRIEAWVRIPTLQGGSGAIKGIYMYFGRKLGRPVMLGGAAYGAVYRTAAAKRNWAPGVGSVQGKAALFFDGLRDVDGSPIEVAPTKALPLNSNKWISGYIVYSRRATTERFLGSHHDNPHPNLIPVYYNKTLEQWRAIFNNSEFTYSPEPGDMIVAAADWGTSMTGRKVNYLAPLPAGESLPHLVWSDDAGERIDGDGLNPYRQVMHFHERPSASSNVYEFGSSDKFSLSFSSGATMGPSTLANGVVGDGIAFNGVSNVIKTTSDTVFDLGGSGHLEVWVNPRRTSGWRGLFCRRLNYYDQNSFTLWINDGIIVVDTQGSTGNRWITGVTVPTGRWSYIVVQATGSQWRLFVNGELRASVNRTHLWPASQSYKEVSIGASINDGNASNYYDGLMDELRFYSGVVPDGLIKTQYNNYSDPASFYSVGGLERRVVISNVSPSASRHDHDSSGTAVLSRQHISVVHNTTTAHSASEGALQQHYKMTPAHSTHGASASSGRVVSAGTLISRGARHSNGATSPAVVQKHALHTDDTLHVHTSDTASSGGTASMLAHSSYHGHSAGRVAGVFSGQNIMPADVRHNHKAGLTWLRALHRLFARMSSHRLSGEEALITGPRTIVANSAKHLHHSNPATLPVAMRQKPRMARVSSSPMMMGRQGSARGSLVRGFPSRKERPRLRDFPR